jgi:predicted N-formylglutamate amidohydrolase
MGTAATSRFDADLVAPVRTVNGHGQSPFVIVCDHASNRIPSRYAGLGLPASELIRHIAWDPGALGVSMRLGELLDAPLVHSTVSRLVVDCNRFPDADTLMPAISEHTETPGNAVITAEDRAERMARYYLPFHDAVDRLLAARRAAGQETILVCMHSFTPTFKGAARPWPVGILPPPDERFSAALLEALRDEVPDANIGWNEPYAAGKGVSYTVDHHGEGLASTMIEIRHDEILEPNGVALWADRVARCLQTARVALRGGPAHLSSPRRGGIRLEGRD